MPAFKTVLTGRCTGGTPKPSLLLEIYGDGIFRVNLFIPPETLIFNQPYVLEWTVPDTISQVHGRMVLSNLLGDYEFLTSVKELGLTLEKWYSVIPTGTAWYPKRINDLTTGIGPGGFPGKPAETGTTPSWGSVGQYVELDFGTIVKIREFSYHGFETMLEDGRWKIAYWDLFDQAWKDWMTNIPTRKALVSDPFTPWKTPPAGVIYTDKVRLIATTIDSNMFNYSNDSGVEMRF